MPVKRTLKDAFDDPGLFCSSALLLLVDAFGTEALNWEPETVYAALADRFGVEMNDLLADKLNAGMTLLTSNVYYADLPAFNAINRVLAFKYADADEFVPATLDDTAWGVTESSLIVAKEDQEPFAPDIARYAGVLLELEGISRPPSILGFATLSSTEQDERAVALAENPEMAAMYELRQTQELLELDRLMKDTLTRLVRQIAELPLQNAPELAEKAAAMLARIEGVEEQTGPTGAGDEA